MVRRNASGNCGASVVTFDFKSQFTLRKNRLYGIYGGIISFTMSKKGELP